MPTNMGGGGITGAEGTVTSFSQSFTVSGLKFEPKRVSLRGSISSGSQKYVFTSYPSGDKSPTILIEALGTITDRPNIPIGSSTLTVNVTWTNNGFTISGLLDTSYDRLDWTAIK